VGYVKSHGLCPGYTRVTMQGTTVANPEGELIGKKSASSDCSLQLDLHEPDR